MIRIRLRAPFAAFRPFAAGWYRPTAAFLTPSAAYGLALNLAGEETRLDDGVSAMTVTRPGLPAARVAVDADTKDPLPTVQTILQQLHNYPVGSSGKERKGDARGNKYNVTPVRREFLSGLHALIALDFLGDRDVEDRIREGGAGKPPRSGRRYGLPFLGDNAFLPDRLEVLDEPARARWYRRLGREAGPAPGSTRLTRWIDRRDMSGPISGLYVLDPAEKASSRIPEEAWTDLSPSRDPT